MDAARIAAIWTELKEYGDETQLGFPLSTIKVGELAELISYNAGQADTIERLQGLSTDLELLAKKRATLLEQAKQERDAALAEVERLRQAREASRLDDLQSRYDWGQL